MTKRPKPKRRVTPRGNSAPPWEIVADFGSEIWLKDWMVCGGEKGEQ